MLILDVSLEDCRHENCISAVDMHVKIYVKTSFLRIVVRFSMVLLLIKELSLMFTNAQKFR